MPKYALTHNGVITRIVEAPANPFRGSLTSVEVTGIPAQIGNRVDAMGNVGPSPAMSPSEAGAMKRAMLGGEAAYQTSRGVWVPAGDPHGHMFDLSPDSLALVAALAAAGAGHVRDADGALVEVSASDVYAAAGRYLAACAEHEATLYAAMDDDADPTEGWPDSGEPDEKAPPVPAPAAPSEPAGTGIVPEMTPDAPHADSNLTVGGTVEAPVVQPG